MPQPHQGTYASPGQMPSPGGTDSFFQNYYTPNPSNIYPFMSQGIGTTEGPWSNGGDTPMFPMSYDYSSMYSGFGFPFGSWDYPSEYWNPPAQAAARKDPRPYQEPDYYPDPAMMQPDSYGMMNGAGPDRGDPMGGVEQGLRGMTIQGGMDKKMDGGMGAEMVGGVPTQEMVSPPPQSVSSSMHGVGSQGMGLSVGGSVGGMGNQAPKKTSWAAIASQPARPQTQVRPRMMPRAPANPNKPHSMDIGTWENRGGMGAGGPVGGKPSPGQRQAWSAPRQRQMGSSSSTGPSNVNSNTNNSGGGHQNHQGASSNPNAYGSGSSSPGNMAGNGAGPTHHPILDKLKQENHYNPKEFNLNTKGARFFIIKSYSEDDIHRSIKYNIWCSTEHGNKRLDSAFRERDGKGPIFLLFSVNGSGHFCGVAQMMSPIDYNKNSSVWAQDKWKGQFEVKWVYVKDVPNSQLRHIRLENNENKPVTNSRDTQEVPPEKGKQVLKILHSYKYTTSIFDDFTHYEKRQEEDQAPPAAPPSHGGHSGVGGDRGDRSQRGGRDGRRGGRHN